MKVTSKATGNKGTIQPTPARGGGMVTMPGQPARWFSAAQVRRFLKVG